MALMVKYAAAIDKVKPINPVLNSQAAVRQTILRFRPFLDTASGTKVRHMTVMRTAGMTRDTT